MTTLPDWPAHAPMAIRSGHFARRVRERLGEDVDPYVLAENIVRAIKEDRRDFVEYVTRVSRTGRRVFRANLRDGRLIFVMVSEDAWPMTLMLPGFTLKRQGKPDLVLA